jgi:hypothetical protein
MAYSGRRRSLAQVERAAADITRRHTELQADYDQLGQQIAAFRETVRDALVTLRDLALAVKHGHIPDAHNLDTIIADAEARLRVLESKGITHGSHQ